MAGVRKLERPDERFRTRAPTGQFFRLKSRRGPKKAIMAVAASMLTAIYYVLRDGTEYRDLGHDYFDKLDSTKLKARLVRKLQELGCDVTIKEAA